MLERALALLFLSGDDPDPDPENGFSHEPGSEPGSGSGSTRDKAKYHEEYVHGWKETEERVCKVVLIGRNLDRDSLEKGFRSCFI
mmetsp:Transcript_2828/g.4007  ORF Transcript_2828/g.4007 Transcript_2828/m.4007 type:complete len:85 (+) Transcript_2828:147-401(+)